MVSARRASGSYPNLDDLVSEEFQRLRGIMQGGVPAPSIQPVTKSRLDFQPPTTSQLVQSPKSSHSSLVPTVVDGTISLREEMLEELERLKHVLRGEAVPVIEATDSTRPSRLQRARFISLRQDMLVELRRLERVFGVSPGDELAEKLSPSEHDTYDKFMRLFSRCPVCGEQNHDAYLQDFYFRTEPEKIALRDSLIRLIEKTTDFDQVYSQGKLAIGIPCCNCFKKIFSKNLFRVFVIIQHGLPSKVIFRHAFNNTNSLIAHFGETYARGQYYMLSGSDRLKGTLQQVDSNDYHFYLLGKSLACYVAMFEGAIHPREMEKIERFMATASEVIEDQFANLIGGTTTGASFQKLHDTLPILARDAGIDV